MRKLCNSLRHWKNKLKPALTLHNVIITLYNEDRDVKLDILTIVDAIEKVGENIKVCGVSEFRNPKYLCVYFNSEEEKETVKSNFKRLHDADVAFLSWAFEEALTVLKVHWLPLSVDIESIRKEVEKYSSIVEEERQILTTLSGRALPAGKLTFRVKMKEAVAVDAVPHLLVISDMDALITIPGRLPLCINCNVLGHVSRKCKARYCHTCRKLVLKKHICAGKSAASYADAARPQIDIDPDASFSEEEEGEPGVVDPRLVSERLDLNKKIESLQSQLLLQENELITQLRLKKKRKKTTAESPVVESEDTSLEDAQSAVISKEAVVVEKPGVSLISSSDTKAINLLSFDSPSSLTPKACNRRTYGRSSTKSKASGSKSDDFFDITFNKDFVFGD